MAAQKLKDIVDLDVYPIHQQDSQTFATLVQYLHDELDRKGIVLLPNFLTRGAIQETLKDIENSTFLPYCKEVTHNVYLEDIPEDDNTENDHPKKVSVRSCKTCFTHDQIDPSTPLNVLFMSDEMTEFLRRVLGKEKLYRTADTLGALNVHKYLDGDELGWHFDRGEFAVTLLLQEPQNGGVFEFYPSLRDENSPNYPKVAEILQLSQAGVDLQEHGVKVAHMKAGTLSIFCGHHSMHRVKPVKGIKPRYLSVLSYEQKPNVCLNDYTKMKFYGRLK